MSNKSYGKGAIVTLSDIDWLRERPENHIRNCDERGQLHVIKEIFDNALDETELHQDGLVNITLFLDSKKQTWQIVIQDNGRGFPLESFLDSFTVLKTSGKFNRDNYVTSSGLNGFGSKVAFALSENIKAITYRDNKIAHFSAHQGILNNSEPVIEQYDGQYGYSGTMVFYEPLAKYFDGVSEFIENYHTQLFHLATLLGIFANHSRIIVRVLHKSIDSKIWTDAAIPTLKYMCDRIYDEALVVVDGADHDAALTYLKELWKVDGEFIWDMIGINSGDIPELEHENMLVKHKTQVVQRDVLLTFRVNMYLPKILRKTSITAVINNIPLKLASSSIHQGLTTAVKNRLVKYIQQDEYRDFFMEVYQLPICATVGVKYSEARFTSLAKDGFEDARFEKRFVKMLTDCFELCLDSDWMLLYQQIEQNIVTQYHVYYNKPMSSKSQARKLTLELMDKHFMDCEEHDPNLSELFIVEGVSATHVCNERDPRYQSVYMIKGKPTNITKSDGSKSIIERIKGYPAYADLMKILNIHPDNTDISHRNYGKIILLQDADVDGGHISALHTGGLYNINPLIYKERMVYLANPPLYETMVGNRRVFVRSKEELIKFRISLYKQVLDLSVQDISKTVFSTPVKLTGTILEDFCMFIVCAGDIYDDISKRLIIPIPVLEHIANNTHKITHGITHDSVRELFGRSATYDPTNHIVTLDYNETDVTVSLADVCDAIYERILPLIKELSFHKTQIYGTTILTDTWNMTPITPMTLYETFRRIDKKMKVERFKGIGGVDSQWIKKTCMNPATRFLHEISEVGDVERIMKVLGDSSETRKEILRKRGILI